MILHSHPSHMNVKPFSGQRWVHSIFGFFGGGEDISSGPSFWIFYHEGCVTVNSSLCLLQERDNNYVTRPKLDNLFVKTWFLYVRKISGNRVFLFLLTISHFVDILDNHQNSFPDSTDIEISRKWKLS